MGAAKLTPSGVLQTHLTKENCLSSWDWWHQRVFSLPTVTEWTESHINWHRESLLLFLPTSLWEQHRSWFCCCQLTYRCVHLLGYRLQAFVLVLHLTPLCHVPQQQRVSSEPLQRRHQQVAQLKPPAQFIPLTPLRKAKREQVRGGHRRSEGWEREGNGQRQEVRAKTKTPWAAWQAHRHANREGYEWETWPRSSLRPGHRWHVRYLMYPLRHLAQRRRLRGSAWFQQLWLSTI